MIAEQKQAIEFQQQVIVGLTNDITELQAHIAGLTAQLSYLAVENLNYSVFKKNSNVIGEDCKKMRTLEALFLVVKKKFFEKRK